MPAVTTFQFIPPTEPVLAETPPAGKGWCHEVKFDGYRLQLVKAGDRAHVWSKNGKDFTPRFRGLAAAVAMLPCKSCVIDAEGVAPDPDGRPDFRALVGGQQHKIGMCFDLLEIDGRDMRPFPLVTRRVRLKALLKRAASETLHYSDAFPDAGDWVKVKCHAWRAANADRGEIFRKR